MTTHHQDDGSQWEGGEHGPIVLGPLGKITQWFWPQKKSTDSRTKKTQKTLKNTVRNKRNIFSLLFTTSCFWRKSKSYHPKPSWTGKIIGCLGYVYIYVYVLYIYSICFVQYMFSKTNSISTGLWTQPFGVGNRLTSSAMIHHLHIICLGNYP